jgi:hypothetical protein
MGSGQGHCRECFEVSALQDWLDKHLVPEWRKAWKWSSVQLAAVISTAITAFAANPNLMLSIINYMPTDPTQRALAAAAVGGGKDPPLAASALQRDQ